MAPRRDYFDGCAAAHALDLVGERWALLVVRELVLGPKRFTDLRAGLPHASPNVLSQRLRELEDAGVLHRRRLPPPAASAVYELTEWGSELEPVIRGLGRWAARSLPVTEERIGVDAAVLALRTMFSPDAAAGVDTALSLFLDEQPFRARITDGAFVVERGGADEPDAVVATRPDVLLGVLLAGRPLDAAIADGELTLTGDRAAVDAMIGLFPMPEPVA